MIDSSVLYYSQSGLWRILQIWFSSIFQACIMSLLMLLYFSEACTCNSGVSVVSNTGSYHRSDSIFTIPSYVFCSPTGACRTARANGTTRAKR